MVSQELMLQKAVKTTWLLKVGEGSGFWKNWAADPGPATPQGRESGSCLLTVVTLSKMGYDKKNNNNNSMFIRKSIKGNHCLCRSSLPLTVSDKLLFISNVSWELLMPGCLPSMYGALISMLSISKYVKEKIHKMCACNRSQINCSSFSPNLNLRLHNQNNTADRSQRDEKRQKWII